MGESVTLRMAGRPARLVGWLKLQDFLECGFAAFKAFGDAGMLKTQNLISGNSILVSCAENGAAARASGGGNML